jgi:hypothetical protein
VMILDLITGLFVVGCNSAGVVVVGGISGVQPSERACSNELSKSDPLELSGDPSKRRNQGSPVLELTSQDRTCRTRLLVQNLPGDQAGPMRIEILLMIVGLCAALLVHAVRSRPRKVGSALTPS